MLGIDRRSIQNFDWVLFGLSAVLVTCGIVNLMSASYGGDDVLLSATVRRQLTALGLGAIVIAVVVAIDYRHVERFAPVIYGAVVALLAATLVLAPELRGARAWLFGGRFQPSELAKIAVVLYLAHRLASGSALKKGVLSVTWPVLGICALVLLAPDFGTAVFLSVVAAAMLLIGGARIGRVLAVIAATAPLLVLVASHYPYMQRRLEFFQGKTNYQQDQALLALGNGGLLGQGLGAGRQKMAYLPEGHSDFVFPNVGEELGFLGVALIGLLFGLILVHGLRVALAASRTNRFAFHVACGATFVVVFQAVVNIAVSTGAAPTKGISLPFLSHGGSNLLISLVAVGLVVNVGRTLEAKA